MYSNSHIVPYGTDLISWYSIYSFVFVGFYVSVHMI